MKTIYSLLLFLCLSLITTKPVLAYEVEQCEFKVFCNLTNRNIPVFAYYPKVSIKRSEFPLILHFHGYSGTGDGSSKLNSAIAAAGYVVLSPSMVDYYQGQPINGKLGQMIRNRTITDALRPFITGKQFDHQATGGTQRIIEARWLLDYFTTTSNKLPNQLIGLYNPNNVAMSGHSFGGYTTLGVAGVAENPSSNRLKAILLYSPGVTMWQPQDFNDITVPMMIQWGDKENRKHKESRACYQNCSGPSFMAVLKDTGHFAWTDQLFGFKGKLHHADANTIFSTIVQLSLDFLDTYLKNDKTAFNRLKANPYNLADYDYRNLK